MNRQKIKKNKSSGFTLTEVLVVAAVLSVLMFVVVGLVISLIEKPKSQLAAMDNIDQARFVSSVFTNEIRAAAYGTYPIIQAQDSEIIFYSPIGASEGNINKIRYYVSDNILYKGVVSPPSVTEIVKPVLTAIANGAEPVFYYYSGDYDGNGTAERLSTPANVNNIKFVEINLIVKKQITSQDTSAFFLKAGATIRILKNNLGN
jgi:prepilin-type N-terminal cleavage/methylation domain-containing protein